MRRTLEEARDRGDGRVGRVMGEDTWTGRVDGQIGELEALWVREERARDSEGR